MGFIKRLFCWHKWVKVDGIHSSFKHRECVKCLRLECGSYASDGRFYWVSSPFKRSSTYMIDGRPQSIVIRD